MIKSTDIRDIAVGTQPEMTWAFHNDPLQYNALWDFIPNSHIDVASNSQFSKLGRRTIKSGNILNLEFDHNVSILVQLI
jgi:hypothetical protein